MSSLFARPLLWVSSHSQIVRFVPLLFAPAGAMLFAMAFPGVVRAEAIATTIAERVITLAMLLFCLELARMAYADLNNVSIITARTAASISSSQPASKAQIYTSQGEEIALLNRFFWVLISTIVLELVGFYLALASPPLGAALVIFSQLWFNALAGVQLFPEGASAVVLFGSLQRVDVLAANSVAIALLCLWPIAAMRVPAAIGLLSLIALFLVLKYAPFLYRKLKKDR